MTYLFVAVTLLIVCIVPRFTKAIPAPLIAIILLTAIAIYGNIDLRTVGDLGAISKTLPVFLIPDIPFSLETLMIILPYSFHVIWSNIHVHVIFLHSRANISTKKIRQKDIYIDQYLNYNFCIQYTDIENR